MTYRSTWRESGLVTLTKGVFRAPVAPGSAAELIVSLTGHQAFGKIDGKDVGAVVLVTQAGGSGSFFDLALLTRKADGWVNSDVAPLGDRVDIEGLILRDNQVVVTMTSHGPNDLMCCPTLRVERRFAVQGGKLTAVGDPVVTPAPAALVGPVWQWVQTPNNNDTKARPSRPGNYTMQFDVNGTVNVRADCNQKGGTFQSRDQSLAIEITHSTRAMCPEDSLEGRFVRNLTSATHWFIKDGDLYLDLKYDTGTMRFQQPR